ncbi:response regulator [Aestuariivirga sp.]|uniref:response regulator n=1 Tax=Aestuariivirga sp. TaxID=2650926 RepID=UPI00391AB811
MEDLLRSAPADSLDCCLVVEDDSIIRLDLEEMLRSFGLRQVLGASSVAAARLIAETAGIRFAVLDYEVGRCNTLEIAETLASRGIPAMFLTGYGAGLELPDSLAHLPVLSKPFTAELLAEALLRTLQPAKRGPKTEGAPDQA